MEQDIEISDADMDTIIDTACDFMNVITGIYGQDKGVELFQKMADIVDPNIYRTMIIKLISGDGFLGRSITVTGSDHNKFVEAIKAVRQVTGMGLKEAKDFMDIVRAGQRNSLSLPKGSKKFEALKVMRNAGIVAN